MKAVAGCSVNAVRNMIATIQEQPILQVIKRQVPRCSAQLLSDKKGGDSFRRLLAFNSSSPPVGARF
jgi:hypothetical protein